MAIIWREAMCVGNQAIDTDHRYLLCLINTVELALRTEQPLDILVSALEQLKTYTHEHFEREEKIMAALGYPRLDQHKIAHRQLVEQLDHAVNPVLVPQEGQLPITSAIPEATRNEIIGLLKHWLIDHIIKEDMLLKPLLAKVSPNYCP
jgi:hemerythrin